jgi:hypothetical protein
LESPEWPRKAPTHGCKLVNFCRDRQKLVNFRQDSKIDEKSSLWSAF